MRIGKNDNWGGCISERMVRDDVFSSIFFFKQKTAYEIYQCDWSSDVCSSDLI